MPVEEGSLRQLFQEHQQDHLFRFWSQLSEDERSNLVSELQTIQPARVNSIFKVATSKGGDT
jgi:uncharacterized protein HemY